MGDAEVDEVRARRWRVGAALALVVGIVAAGSAVALRPSPRPWVVEVLIEHPGLGYDDPCLPMPDRITGGYMTGGGSYGGLLLTDSERDAQAVAACYQAHGVTAEVRRQSDEDARRIQEVGG